MKECKIYQNKGSRGSPAPCNLTKVFAWGRGDLAVYENLPGGMIALGTDSYKTQSMLKGYLEFQRTRWMNMDLQVVIF